MTDGSVFKIIYVAGMISMFVIRLACRVRRGGSWPAEPRHRSLEAVLLGLAFVGMLVVPLVYVFTGAPGFADYRLPAWAGWAGAAVFLAALWLLRRSHADLGRNWSQTLELREGHELVTWGVYRRVRHPMYAALWLWGLAQPLLLRNWVAGFSHLASFAALYFLRVPREERMMLDHFGAEYGAYMRRTGRVLPRLTPREGMTEVNRG
jgi:protein-S-isoprenylcysteine O-methyltransferase Ste14